MEESADTRLTTTDCLHEEKKNLASRSTNEDAEGLTAPTRQSALQGCSQVWALQPHGFALCQERVFVRPEGRRTGCQPLSSRRHERLALAAGDVGSECLLFRECGNSDSEEWIDGGPCAALAAITVSHPAEWTMGVKSTCVCKASGRENSMEVLCLGDKDVYQRVAHRV